MPDNVIQITVQADTQQALQAVKTFADQSAGSLKVLSAGTKQVADEVAKSSEHIRGMAYYFRSGIDSVRFALAGGGERAGFYALDELTRGLVSSGIAMSKLIPIAGVLGAAVAAGVFAWHEWNSGVAEAEKHAKDLANAMKELPKLVQQIMDMQKVGILGPTQAQEYLDYATGRKKLYMNSAGQVTTSATDPNAATSIMQQQAVASGRKLGAGFLGPMVNNRALDPTKDHDAIDKWLQDNITANGEVSKEQLDALAALQQETRKVNDEALTGIEKQKAAIRDRYAQERAEIEQNLAIAKAHMDVVSFGNSNVVKNAQAALDQSHANEQGQIDQLVATQAAEQMAKARELASANFKAANDAIEEHITQMAEQQGKTREQLYQEEYGLRAGLATEMFMTGQVSVDEYSAAVINAQQKMLESQRKVNEELQREQRIRDEIARTQAEGRLRQIQGNPFLTEDQKGEQSIPIYQQMQQRNWSQMMAAGHTAATTTGSAQAEAQLKIVQLMQQQYELQQKINTASGTNANSWNSQLQQMYSNFTNIKTLAQTTTDIFSGALNTGINSVAGNLTKVIEGTEKWRKAVLSIEEAIVSNLISAIIKAAEQWIVSEVMKYTLGETLQQAAVAGTAATAAEESMIWWTPAILSAIASGGTTAADAAALVGGAIVGFAEGGRPDVGRISLVGERGPELFIPDSAGTVIPAHQTAAILQGRGDVGGGNSSVSVQGNTHNFHFWDERPHPKDYLNSSEGQNHVVEIVRGNRQKVGIRT